MLKNIIFAVMVFVLMTPFEAFSSNDSVVEKTLCYNAENCYTVLIKSVDRKRTTQRCQHDSHYYSNTIRKCVTHYPHTEYMFVYGEAKVSFTLHEEVVTRIVESCSSDAIDAFVAGNNCRKVNPVEEVIRINDTTTNYSGGYGSLLYNFLNLTDYQKNWISQCPRTLKATTDNLGPHINVGYGRFIYNNGFIVEVEEYENTILCLAHHVLNFNYDDIAK